MAVHWGGVVAIVIFYLLILAVGLWAARKGKGSSDTEDVMIAGRNIGLAVGIFTMTGKVLSMVRVLSSVPGIANSVMFQCFFN